MLFGVMRRTVQPERLLDALNNLLLGCVLVLLGVWAGLRMGEPVEPPVDLALFVLEEEPEPPQLRAAVAETPGTNARQVWARHGISQAAWENAPVIPALNMRETASSYDVSVSLSGVNPRDISIRTEGSLLIIRAAAGSTAPVRTEGRLRIPHDAQLDALAASFSNGVLRVTIPRSEAASL